MMILYINACVREESRTDYIARKLLEKLGDYEEVNLNTLSLKPLDRETLEYRSKLIEEGKFEHPMFELARKFASADAIVIGAPFWDFSFPACLKIFIENIYITGLVSRYGEDGMPVGLCKAKKLYYVTTAGGKFVPTYSYQYISDLATLAFGIQETKLIAAEMLDIVGQDAAEIVNRTIAELEV